MAGQGVEEKNKLEECYNLEIKTSKEKLCELSSAEYKILEKKENPAEIPFGDLFPRATDGQVEFDKETARQLVEFDKETARQLEAVDKEGLEQKLHEEKRKTILELRKSLRNEIIATRKNSFHSQATPEQSEQKERKEVVGQIGEKTFALAASGDENRDLIREDMLLVSSVPTQFNLFSEADKLACLRQTFNNLHNKLLEQKEINNNAGSTAAIGFIREIGDKKVAYGASLGDSSLMVSYIDKDGRYHIRPLVSVLHQLKGEDGKVKRASEFPGSTACFGEAEVLGKFNHDSPCVSAFEFPDGSSEQQIIAYSDGFDFIPDEDCAKIMAENITDPVNAFRILAKDVRSKRNKKGELIGTDDLSIISTGESGKVIGVFDGHPSGPGKYTEGSMISRFCAENFDDSFNAACKTFPQQQNQTYDAGFWKKIDAAYIDGRNGFTDTEKKQCKEKVNDHEWVVTVEGVCSTSQINREMLYIDRDIGILTTQNGLSSKEEKLNAFNRLIEKEHILISIGYAQKRTPLAKKLAEVLFNSALTLNQKISDEIMLYIINYHIGFNSIIDGKLCKIEDVNALAKMKGQLEEHQRCLNKNSELFQQVAGRIDAVQKRIEIVTAISEAKSFCGKVNDADYTELGDERDKLNAVLLKNKSVAKQEDYSFVQEISSELSSRNTIVFFAGLFTATIYWLYFFATLYFSKENSSRTRSASASNLAAKGPDALSDTRVTRSASAPQLAAEGSTPAGSPKGSYAGLFGAAGPESVLKPCGSELDQPGYGQAPAPSPSIR